MLPNAKVLVAAAISLLHAADASPVQTRQTSSAAIPPSIYSAIGTSPSVDAFRNWAGWDAYFTNARRLPDYTVVYTGKQAVSPYSSTILYQNDFSSAAADFCAAKCNVDPYCAAVEMAVERVPATQPSAASPNPAAKFVVSCHLHNKPLSSSDATYSGRLEQKFQRTQTAVTFFNRKGWKKAYPSGLGQSCKTAACGSGLTCEASSKTCRLAAGEFCAGPQDDGKCATGLCSFSSPTSHARCTERSTNLVPQDRHCLADSDCNSANCSSDTKRCGPALAATTVTLTIAPAKTTVMRTVTETSTVTVDAALVTTTATTTQTSTIPTVTTEVSTTTSTSTATERTTTTTTTATVTSTTTPVMARRVATHKRAVSGPTVTVKTTAAVETVTRTATITVTATATRAAATTTVTATVSTSVTSTSTTSQVTTAAATATTTETIRTATTTTTTVAADSTPRVRLKLVKAVSGALVGYLGQPFGGFTFNRLYTSPSDAIHFKFLPPDDGTLFNIEAPPGSPYPYLGAIAAGGSDGYDLNEGGYLDPTFIPLVPANTHSKPNPIGTSDNLGPSETQIWSFDKTTNMLSLVWTQGDGCEYKLSCLRPFSDRESFPLSAKFTVAPFTVNKAQPGILRFFTPEFDPPESDTLGEHNKAVSTAFVLSRVGDA